MTSSTSLSRKDFSTDTIGIDNKNIILYFTGIINIRRQVAMLRKFTLEYWIDDGWYVGKLMEVSDIFSQGKTLKELEENIQDAFHLMSDGDKPSIMEVKTKEIGIEV